MSKSKHTIQFNLLKDQPLQSSADFENMKFGHSEIADTVTQIATQCTTPFTIGLFGRWGSGKSTIAFKVAESLKQQNIPIVMFDVWKHEGDSLRRSFLKECYEQLKGDGEGFLKSSYTLDERVEHGVTRTTEGSLKLNKELWRLFRRIAVWVLIAVVPLSFLVPLQLISPI